VITPSSVININQNDQQAVHPNMSNHLKGNPAYERRELLSSVNVIESGKKAYKSKLKNENRTLPLTLFNNQVN
jgi:hypothetical protein